MKRLLRSFKDGRIFLVKKPLQFPFQSFTKLIGESEITKQVLLTDDVLERHLSVLCRFYVR